MRLSNDTYSGKAHGIVEVMKNGVPVRVCHQGWDDIDAHVTCKGLGFKVSV